MTIAYLTSRYARASDTFVRAEVAELRALGHTVHTFSIRRPSEDELSSDAVRAEYDRTDYVLAHGPALLVAATVRAALRRPLRFARALALALRIGNPGMRGRLWPFAYLVEAAYLAGRLEALGVQHLHDHIAEGSAAVAMLAGELARVPFSVTVHGPGEFDDPASLALDVKLERAAFFTAISDYARSQVLRWVRPDDWGRVHVVLCGVERRFLDGGATPPAADPVFVSIGRLDVQKGQLVLIEAVARLRDAGVRVEVDLVGDGPLRGRLERAAAALGVDDRVRFAGWLGGESVRERIERSRALAMASLAEGLPIVVMEALALGRPVVATDVGAVGELVEHGVTGWLVPAGAVEPLAAALRAAAEADAGELERMGAAGAERVRRRHDAAQTARRLEQLFRS
jgi:colanic acid/amylovoran biosynthesis glycosyltransferase